MLEFYFSVFGILSATILIPSCYRVWKRKSSSDFSIITIILGIACQTCWLFYSLFFNLMGLRNACVAWLILMVLQLFLVLKYRHGCGVKPPIK